jgi:hypothetical protein
MIISASYKTDIPAFHGAWFLNRLAAGDCRVANPWGGPPFSVSLKAEDVDGFVFWTRNPQPFKAGFEDVAARGFPFVVQVTITGYPRALERSVPDTAAAVAQVRALSAAYGRDAVVWRYDPIVATSLTDGDFHRRNFAALAAGLAGATDAVVVSWAQVYRKTRRNMDAAARAHGFTWWDPEDDEKRALIRDLAGIAADHGLTLTVCTQPDLLSDGIGGARCIDAGRLSRVAGRAIAAPVKGNRPGCLCHRSRDIGAYDTCVQGCAYCYAVADRARAQQNLDAADPSGEFLLAPRGA